MPTQRSPDYRTLAEVLQYGKLLGSFPFPLSNAERLHSFGIPWEVSVGSLYTVYWMWNTTLETDRELLVCSTYYGTWTMLAYYFQIYTSCFDIEIIPPYNNVTTEGITSSLSSPYVQPYSTRDTLSSPSTTLKQPRASRTSHLSQATNATTTVPPNTPSRIGLTSSPDCVSTSMSETFSSHTLSVSSMSITDTRTISTARQITGIGSTQTVTVDAGNITSFQPLSLNVSIGDTVVFFPANGPFELYNTTLEDACMGISRYLSNEDGNIIYNVSSLEPTWFLGLQHEDGGYYCYPSSHFSLNPGNQSERFSSAVQTETYISFYSVLPMATSFTTVVVPP